MKWMLCLFVIVLLISAPFGQTIPAAAAEISGASAAQILAELQKMNGELAALKAEVAAVKTELAVVKADVAALRTELRTTKTELKEYVDFKIEALNGKQEERDKRIAAEIRAVNRRVAVTEYLLIALVTALVTVLLWMLKNQWDKRRADRGKMDAQEKEIATQQAEIAALRAENERMKNASGLVSSTGGQLESE